MVYGEVRHYRVKQQLNSAGDIIYFISSRTQFLSLQELIGHYHEHLDGLAIALTTPCIKVMVLRQTID